MMNLKNYINYFIKDEDHWYISKIKQFTPSSINQLAHGLDYFISLLKPNPKKSIFTEYETFLPPVKQYKIFPDYEINQVKVNKHSKLFLALKIHSNHLVDLGQAESKNPVKAMTFKKIIKDFNDGKSYNYLVNKYEESFINSEFEVHFRNFESWLTKFGFMGRINDNSEYCFFTPAGLEFAKSKSDEELSSAIFLAQIKKLQVWNPSMDRKYNKIKVVPYYLILQLLLQLDSNKFYKNEYILFITKLKSHSKKDIETCLSLIREFRQLTREEQTKYISRIEKEDSKKFKTRDRTNYDRLRDSSTKEISAYTFGGLTTVDESDQSIKLVNIELALRELKTFEKSAKYIEFNKKEDWIWHFGSLNGLKIDEILEIYVNEGKSLAEILATVEIEDSNIEKIVKDKLFEKQIEDYYEKNISKIHPQLTIVTRPDYGRQFSTPVGPIDLLCQHKQTNAYFVIEFKRSQVSDDTIGQILRYMGWVHLIMERKKNTVFGIIVGNEFPDKFSYAMEGIQSPHIYKLIEQFKHNFDEKNRPPKN